MSGDDIICAWLATWLPVAVVYFAGELKGLGRKK